MIVVDTNVVSESIRSAPDARVRTWLNRQSPSTLYISAVSVSELLLGVALLDDGQRKVALGAAVEEALALMFDDRLLPFDRDAAESYAAVMAAARRRGETVSVADGQIAASALSRRFAVATRDVRPFTSAGVDVIDPWQ